VKAASDIPVLSFEKNGLSRPNSHRLERRQIAIGFDPCPLAFGKARGKGITTLADP